MLDDSYFMKQALIEAVKAGERGEVPVGAVVVCKERIIARAHNPTETLNDVTAHAEMQAITAAANVLGGKYLNECTLYVTVEPCVMCAGAIAYGLKRESWCLVPKMIREAIRDMLRKHSILKQLLSKEYWLMSAPG